MAEKIFKGFELIKEANFNSLTSKDKQKIYFVRTDEGKEDGFIYFNGKKYGTGKLSSKAVQDKLTELTTEVNKHIANKASVTATARTSGENDNGALSVDVKEKWLSGAAIEEIKTYVDSEDVKNMVLTGNKIQLQNKSNVVLAELDASSFIKDGMLESVTLTTGTTKGDVLRFTWNTDAEKTVTDIEVSEFFHEISGDNTTITVTKPASGTTGILQISAKTVASVSGVTSGATALMTGGITQQYVQQEINTFKTGLTNTFILYSNISVGEIGKPSIGKPYALLTIQQTNGKLDNDSPNNRLQVVVATGLTQDHAGLVYDSTGHTFTAKESAFTKKGLLDAQEVIALLRNNNTNVADALTYLNGQITALSDNMTTVTGSDYIRVDKELDTNNYRVSASGTLQTAIDNANSAVQSVNGQNGPEVTINSSDINLGKEISGHTTADSVTTVLEDIYDKLSQTSSNALTSVSGSTSINVTAKASGSQTISVKAKHLSETEKVAGQIEIITTGTTGIYGLLYFGGDDVEDGIATEMRPA